ncbi:50S ribosomal protein L9 [candidate division KSB1 bacterium]
MDIILKQDITSLGSKHDIISVKPGYARNYLIPKGYAILATANNKKVVEEIKKQQEFKEARNINDAGELAEKLKDIKLKIGAKAATTGKIFGSVNAIQISNAIKEQYNYEIDRKKISVDGDSIKEIGIHKATIKLHKEVNIEVEFEVFAE